MFCHCRWMSEWTLCFWVLHCQIVPCVYACVKWFLSPAVVLEDVIFSHIPPEIDECDGLVKENTAYANVLDSGNVWRAMILPDTSMKGEKMHKIVGQ